MHPIRKDPGIRRRSALLLLCFLGLMLSFCLASVIGRPIAVVGISCSVAGMAYCMISTAVRIARFRCPNCGKRLKSKARQPGDAHRYYCPTCAVEWVTGWRLPED